jgi:hypothetical protein
MTLPRFTTATTPYAESYERAVAIVDLMRAAGVRVPPSGRLKRYLKLLETMCAVTPDTRLPKSFNLQELHRAMLELDELGFITRQLSKAPEVAGWVQLMNAAMAGRMRPSDERNHNRARDIQFELHTAAMFRLGGYQVTLEEPDVVVGTSWGQIGLAAKRPRSPANLDNLFKDADEQIERSGRQGIVVIDISFVNNPDDMHVQTDDALHGLAVARAMTDTFVNRNAPHIRSLLKESHTIGFAVHAAVLVEDVVMPRLASGRGLVFSNKCSLDDPRLAILKEFSARVTCAIPSA